MTMHASKRSGILAAGNWILDQVKVVDKFPEEQSLVNILSEYTSNGGSAYNVLMGLSKLEAPFELEAIGLVGNDHNGHWILNHCQEAGINTQQLHITADVPTSYTIVTSVMKTGKRTFFHHRGANSVLDRQHFDLPVSNAKIFHLGYLLLLDRLDEIGADGVTGASEILKKAKMEGFITSVDLVSEDSLRFGQIIPCSLPHVDILFLNEYEASRLSGIDLTAGEDEIATMHSSCESVFEVIFGMGVRDWIIIHRPEGVWAANRSGTRLFQPSLRLPEGQVVGANGAGDALAAGVLLGVHEDWDMRKALQLGVCAAASSLSHASCSDGILPFHVCLDFIPKYGYKDTVRSGD